MTFKRGDFRPKEEILERRLKNGLQTRRFSTQRGDFREEIQKLPSNEEIFLDRKIPWQPCILKQAE